MANMLSQKTSGGAHRTEKLIKVLAQPHTFGDGVGHTSVFSLGGRTRANRLPFRRPANKCVAQVDAEPRGSPARVRAAAQSASM